MRINRLLLAAALLSWASVASAQTFGPPIKGMCLLSRSGAINASLAGQSLQAQLGQMRASLNGELAQRRNSIEQQRRQLEARQNSTTPIEYRRQLASLDQQMEAIEQQQNARFIAAQARGQQQIDGALGRALAQVVTRSGCSLVLERDHSYGWNNAMDITDAVTKEMNGLLRAVVLS